jgi:hypothetical protein
MQKVKIVENSNKNMPLEMFEPMVILAIAKQVIDNKNNTLVNVLSLTIRKKEIIKMKILVKDRVILNAISGKNPDNIIKAVIKNVKRKTFRIKSIFSLNLKIWSIRIKNTPISNG